MTTSPNPNPSPVEEAEAPKPVQPVPTPKTGLPLGDVVLNTLKHGRHIIQLIKRTDPNQHVPFLMKCSCGTEGRFHSENAIKDFAEQHILRRGPR